MTQSTDFLPLLPRQRAVQLGLDAADLEARGRIPPRVALPAEARLQGGRWVEPLHHHSFATTRQRDMRKATR